MDTTTNRKVYLDYIAGASVLPEVVDAMLPYFKDIYGNPQSIHDWGDQSREALDTAREQVASLIKGNVGEIIFTGSGTEFNNLASKGLVQEQAGKGKHIVVSLGHP